MKPIRPQQSTTRFLPVKFSADWYPLTVCCFFAAVVLTIVPSFASPPTTQSDTDLTRHALAETNRVLEEELKLAVRPQVYLVVDLPHRIILVKARGIELHRLPMTAWRLTHEPVLDGSFRLRARPAVSRPKAAPTGDDLPPVIELKDMPHDYDLTFDPAFVMTVSSTPGNETWQWARHHVREWWTRLASGTSFLGKSGSFDAPHLYLTLSQGDTQSLAWLLTDGMPVILHRS